LSSHPSGLSIERGTRSSPSMTEVPQYITMIGIHNDNVSITSFTCLIKSLRWRVRYGTVVYKTAFSLFSFSVLSSSIKALNPGSNVSSKSSFSTLLPFLLFPFNHCGILFFRFFNSARARALVSCQDSTSSR